MSDNMNPWGNRDKKPSELDEIIQKGLKKIFNIKQGNKPPSGQDSNLKPPGMNFGIVLVLLLILFLGFQSVYQIQPNEQGVVLRFGKFNNVTSPGLNFLIPFIEKVIKVDVESIRKEEFGFRQNVSRTYSQASNALDLESLMITADKNVIQLNWVVQYKIRDAESFIFNIRDPRAAVRDVSESVIRRLVGNRDFDYVLNNREELATSTLQEMQDVIDKYNSGIQLVVVQLQDLNPPDPVRPSFNEVNEAEQDKIRVGNEAQKEANTKIPKALGTAKKIIQEAEGYAIERVNRAEGDVARFNAILKQYVSAKEVTRTRMYVETLTNVLPNVRDIVVIDPSK
ncbi:MAG: FtsH protease activity modulator HflK, partial [Deltaproteobacteria bacterium]|nr:FtsH protease activity modulator HflK [Deltaproteobacteria bacterium]